MNKDEEGKDDVILALIVFICILAIVSAILSYNLGFAQGYIERDKMETNND